MKKKQRAEELLRNLREAIDEALGESHAVAAAIGELEDAGFCPSLCVKVALPAGDEYATIEAVSLDEGLVLTASDESFLRMLGIVAPPV